MRRNVREHLTDEAPRILLLRGSVHKEPESNRSGFRCWFGLGQRAGSGDADAVAVADAPLASHPRQGRAPRSTQTNLAAAPRSRGGGGCSEGDAHLLDRRGGGKCLEGECSGRVVERCHASTPISSCPGRNCARVAPNWGLGAAYLEVTSPRNIVPPGKPHRLLCEISYPDLIVPPGKRYRPCKETLSSCSGTNIVLPGNEHRPLREPISSHRGKVIVPLRKCT